MLHQRDGACSCSAHGRRCRKEPTASLLRCAQFPAFDMGCPRKVLPVSLSPGVKFDIKSLACKG
eukprot:4424468-Amphidinium_carterae.1